MHRIQTLTYIVLSCLSGVLSLPLLVVVKQIFYAIFWLYSHARPELSIISLSSPETKIEPLYKWLESLNDRIKVVEGLENTPLLDKMDKDFNNMVCFDDLVLEKNQTRIANYYIRARKLNCSVLYLSQSYFGVPKIIRQNCTYLILLKLSGAWELNLILSEGGLGIDKNELLRIYKDATAEKFSPLNYRL